MKNAHKEDVEELFQDFFQKGKINPEKIGTVIGSLIEDGMKKAKKYDSYDFSKTHPSEKYNWQAKKKHRANESTQKKTWTVEVCDEVDDLQSQDNSQRGNQTEQPNPTVKFHASEFNWDARKAYIILQDNRERLVTGCVPFDNNLGFTKAIFLDSDEFVTMAHCAFSSIKDVRLATDDEQELLAPPPTQEESLQIIRTALSTPRQKRALEVVLRSMMNTENTTDKTEE